MDTTKKRQKITKDKKSSRLIIAAASFLLLGLFIAYFFSDNLTAKIISAIAVLISSSLFTYIYLQGGFDIINRSFMFEDIRESNITVNSDVDYQGLSEEIIKKILSENEGRYIELLDYIEKLKFRLKTQVDYLSRNGNLNLLIGLITTVIAVSILFYLVFAAKDLPKDNYGLISYYVARISIIIFIEIFALFFLKLYRTNLYEIKYFQNELTNIDVKIIALKTALMMKDDESIKLVISELSKTERNFILKKDETTYDLERYKQDKEDNRVLIENLTQILKGFTNKETSK